MSKWTFKNVRALKKTEAFANVFYKMRSYEIDVLRLADGAVHVNIKQADLERFPYK